MATYAIGDVQGCYRELTQLLSLINFNEQHDTLWFAGDLVNRGPQSLEVLRLIRSLSAKHVVVLGNHDLHLLARAHHAHAGFADDTLDSLLAAPDCQALISWLSQKPLLHYDAASNFALAHAGIAPMWTLPEALSLSQEVQNILTSSTAKDFFATMYGNTPTIWKDELTGWDRIRCITNYFTRMRYCDVNGGLMLDKHNDAVKGYPWFTLEKRKTRSTQTLFGHWAALGGETNTTGVFALDTGCVWGERLTAQRLEDGKRFSVPAIKL